MYCLIVPPTFMLKSPLIGQVVAPHPAAVASAPVETPPPPPASPPPAPCPPPASESPGLASPMDPSSPVGPALPLEVVSLVHEAPLHPGAGGAPLPLVFPQWAVTTRPHAANQIARLPSPAALLCQVMSASSMATSE